MSIEDCSEQVTDPIIVLRGENGMSARFANPDRELHTKYRIDGCIVKHQLAADWAVVRHGVGGVVVELKGKDVKHGTDQIIESVQMMKAVDPNLHLSKIAGLLVSVRVPHGARTDLQRQQLRFRKQFRARLEACTGGKEWCVRSLVTAGSK